MTDSVAKRAKELRTGTAPYDLAYTFDAAGNRLTKTKDAVQTSYSYNDANRLLQAVTGQSTTTYTWDTRGNLTAKDVDGNATTYGYSLTDDDKLTEVNGAPAFRYDADGRKFKLGDGETLQQYDGERVLRETPGQSAMGDTRTHVYGLQLLRTYVVPPMMEPPQHLFYHFDGQGSTRALTDENGNVAATYVYDAYGNLVASTGTASTAYKYVGAERYREAGYGLLWVGSRHYDPEVGRWTTEDTWLGDPYRTLSVNRYLYCEGDPVKLTDPGGNSWVGETWEWMKDKIGALGQIATGAGEFLGGVAVFVIGVCVGVLACVGGGGTPGPVILGGVCAGGVGVPGAVLCSLGWDQMKEGGGDLLDGP